MTRRSRRDFLLDSGGVSALAADLVDRLIKAIGAEGNVYAPLTVDAAVRAGVLRAEASRGSHRDISTTDAQIVAMAEERSYRHAVTIITGDPHDINVTREPHPSHQHRRGRPQLIRLARVRPDASAPSGAFRRPLSPKLRK